MTLFAVNFQLNYKIDYSELWSELNRLKGQKVMKSFWYLDLPVDHATTIRDHLTRFISENDVVAVAALNHKPKYRSSIKDAEDWIAAQF